MSPESHRKNRALRFVMVQCALLSLVSLSVAAEEPVSPVFVTEWRGRVMQEWNGTRSLFHDDPYPVRMFLHVVAEPAIRKSDIEHIFSSYRVSVSVDSSEVPADKVAVSRRTIVRGIHHYYVVTVAMKTGKWPEGYVIVRGGLDATKLREHGAPRVRLLSDHKNIRFVSRAMKSQEDRLQRMRYEVFRFANDERCLPWEPDRALKASKALLREFPDDCYAHASAGFVLDRQGNFDAAIKHYSRVAEQIKRAFPQDPLFWLKAIQEPGTVVPTKEYRALRFDSWQGARGPGQILELMNARIHVLRRAPKASATKDPAESGIAEKDQPGEPAGTSSPNADDSDTGHPKGANEPAPEMDAADLEEDSVPDQPQFSRSQELERVRESVDVCADAPTESPPKSRRRGEHPGPSAATTGSRGWLWYVLPPSCIVALAGGVLAVLRLRRRPGDS